ncbi:MAG TPA: phosphoribosyltransferase family protein, partial [Anaerolineaceae bacterium]|nr:phosphoribosyltransferase family protein [Anaerolineaceae bacterium]
MAVQAWQDFIKRELVSEEKLQARIKEMGEEITRDFAGKEILVISILRGGVMITTDLIRHIHLPLAVEFMAVASYEQGMRQSDGDVRITLDLRTPIKGRHVLIVEDIIDSGHTLNSVM